MKTYRVLVADDEKPVRRILEKICQILNWKVDSVEDGKQAIALMEQYEYEIFTVDVNMPGPSGVELSRLILERYEAPAIIILTGYADVQQAVEATKNGVYNYIEKDSMNLGAIQECLMQAALYHENLLLSNQARKQRESEIQNNEIASKQFQAVFDLSPDMIFIADAKTMQITDCNSSACERLEFTRAEFKEQSLSCLINIFSTKNLYEFISTTSKHSIMESTVQTKSGMTIPVEISYTHICLFHGEYISVMLRDISERKVMEAQIVHERNMLHLLMDNMPDLIYFKDKDLKYTCINKAYLSKLNLTSSDQALTKSDQELLPKNEALHIQSEELLVLNTKNPLINQVHEYFFPDGSKKWYTSSKVPILNQEMSVQGLISISRDISSIKNSEQKLLQSTNKLEKLVVELDSIIEGMPLGVLLIDELFQVTHVNHWIESLLHIPKELLTGLPVVNIFKEYFQIDIEITIQSLQNNNEFEFLEQKFELNESEYKLIIKPVCYDQNIMGVVIFICTNI